MADCLFRNWTDAMRRGDFAGAWELSDLSLRQCRESGASKHGGERHLQRIWRGEDLGDQRVLIRCYHGLGDTIQFIRFAAPLRKIARQVIVWAQAELLPLLRRMEGIDLLMPLHDGTPDADYDVDIEVMELAHALRATGPLISSSVPYLSHDAQTTRRNQGLSIGLVWEAGNRNDGRSVPPLLFARLLDRSGVRLLSFQQGPARAMAAAIPAVDAAIADLATLASRLATLDLVVTVDTMTAHLAGALGVPVWTLLPRDCDWRWPLTGRDSIWYPTMRLFHQRTQGDWTDVVEDVFRELASVCPSVAVSPRIS